jgi:subtilisin family serine protease
LQHRRKLLAGLAAATMLLGLGQSGWAAPPDARHAGDQAGNTRASRYTVTLLTGDRVTVSSARATSAAIRPAKGRAHLRFLTFHAGGDLYVVPQDAVRLLRAGKLDRRLFDVSALVRFGYDDARRATLPLIVSYQKNTAHPNAAMAAAGARVTRALPDVGGAAVAAAKDKAPAAWSTLTSAAGIAHIWLDGKRQLSLDQSVPQIGAPAAWQAGYTGKGVSVAVLDTGIDATHPDLAGKIVEAQNFSDAPDVTDTVGHGTHVASIIAGTGAASGGRYKGVAPDATLLVGKVCEDFGCTESAILAGMQWAAAEKHAKAANLSLGGSDTPDIDPLEEAVNSLTAQYGTLFVIAAGNDGPGDSTVSSPGSADAALTVGAVDKSDALASFSSRGPRIGDDAMKPDITAPGVDIVAARAAGTELGDPVGDSYVTLSGTSMATPHVTGSVAILAQEHPDWSAARFKATLTGSARPNPAITGFQQGAGRVDVARAIGQSVTTDPVSVSFGRQVWPHDDDKPVTKTVTYHNDGTAAVTLNLAVKVLGPQAAPAGLFTLSANQVTVPAGGTASVDVTSDTRVGGADGLYSGELLATGGQAQVSTALGVNKEVESYNLTVNFRDRTGALTGDSVAILTGLDSDAFYFLGDASGSVKVRLPKARYDLSAFLFPQVGTNPDRFDQILMAQPLVNLTKDLTVELDGRTAEPVRETVPNSEARPALVEIGYLHTTPTGGTGASLISDTFDGLYSRQQGPPVPAGQTLVGDVGSQWARPNQDGGFDGSPYEYAVEDSLPGGLPTGFVKHYRERDLATVRADQGVAEPGDVGLVDTFGLTASGGFAVLLQVPLPSTFTRYVGGHVDRWVAELNYGQLTDEGFVDTRAYLQGTADYRAGRTYREQWNRGPFGPAFPTPAFSGDFITRIGDTIVVDPPLFSDGAGHAGFSVTDKASTKLFRNGVLLAESADAFGFFDVPADPATYRVEVTAARTGFGGLTSSVSASWTFRSGHVPDDAFVQLRAMAVRFTPRLSADNTAPAGRFEIPVSVQEQPGPPSARVRLLGVQVSYDDGATWQPAAVHRTRDGWVAVVRQPATGFVSLRASATDSAGGRVEQTIIHGYGLTAR